MAERIWFQTPPNAGRSLAPSEQRLAEALKAKDRLLKERPSLQAYQDEIDRALQNVIGYEDRMAVLGVMMEAKLHELRESFEALQSVTHKYDSILKAVRQDDDEHTGLTS
jgi:flagellar motility protein MotE (MotC chaperone)